MNRIARQIGPRQTFQRYPASIRSQKPGPYHEHMRLPVGNPAIIRADRVGTLRNEQVATGHSVIHILLDHASDLSGQIAVDVLVI